MNTIDLLEKLNSKDRRIERLETENKRLTIENKQKSGVIREMKKRNKGLKYVIANMADHIEDGHERLAAYMAIVKDCKHLD